MSKDINPRTGKPLPYVYKDAPPQVGEHKCVFAFGSTSTQGSRTQRCMACKRDWIWQETAERPNGEWLTVDPEPAHLEFTAEAATPADSLDKAFDSLRGIFDPEKPASWMGFQLAPHAVSAIKALEETEAGDITLRRDDPFEAALAEMALTFRRKNADYARSDARWSNFEDMARFLGRSSSPWMSALMLCQQKLSRVSALMSSKKQETPQNESVLDSLLDNAVYAAIALAMAKEQRS